MKIEREIVIDAPLARVWSLVAEPGWWIGADHPTVEAVAGELYVASHPTEGTFPVQAVTVDPPRYVAYRWASARAGITPDDGNSTLIEFTLVEEGTAIRVSMVESGFDAIDFPEDVRRRNLEANSGGWDAELAGLKDRAEKAE